MKICAGVNHAFVEPELVEIIADVVVVLDIATRTGKGVAPYFVKREEQFVTLPVRRCAMAGSGTLLPGNPVSRPALQYAGRVQLSEIQSVIEE